MHSGEKEINEFVLAEQTHAFIASRSWQVAVLPFGATEPHNLHLPYGTDSFQVEQIGRRACAWAYARGARVLLLPLIPFGVNTNHLQIPGALTVSLNPTTLLHILEDVVDSLERQGIRKLLLLNGHGGNELKPLMRQLYHRTKVFLCLCDWYRMAADQYGVIFERPAEHADESETSLGLAFFPHLVRMDQAGPGRARPCRLQGVRNGWISIVRPWHLLTSDAGVGDPSAASADKGRQLMEVIVERIGSFLCELSAAEMDEQFPY